MKNILKELKSSFYLSAILYVILGIVLVFFPEISMKTVCYFCAVILLVVAIAYIVTYFMRDVTKSYFRYDFVIGISAAAVAIFIFIRVEDVMKIIPILLGFAILMSSIIKFQRSLDLMRAHFAGWWGILIVAALSAALGIFIIADPKFAGATIVVIIGLSMIWNGITDIATGMFFSKKMKQIIKDQSAIDLDEE